jgi:hypothetical protein
MSDATVFSIGDSEKDTVVHFGSAVVDDSSTSTKKPATAAAAIGSSSNKSGNSSMKINDDNTPSPSSSSSLPSTRRRDRSFKRMTTASDNKTANGCTKCVDSMNSENIRGLDAKTKDDAIRTCRFNFIGFIVALANLLVSFGFTRPSWRVPFDIVVTVHESSTSSSSFSDVESQLFITDRLTFANIPIQWTPIFVNLYIVVYNLICICWGGRYYVDLGITVRRTSGRWILHGIVLVSLLLSAEAYMGISDIFIHILSFAVIITSVVFMDQAERVNSVKDTRTSSEQVIEITDRTESKKKFIGFAFLISLSVWGILIWAHERVRRIKGRRMLWWESAFVITTLLYNAAILVNHSLQQIGVGPWNSFGFGERCVTIVTSVCVLLLSIFVYMDQQSVSN